MIVQRSGLSVKVLRILQSLVRKMNSVKTCKTDGKKNAIAGICHMRATNNKTDNLEQICKIVELAQKQSTQFLFIPECCDFVGQHRKETLELAEPLNGSTVQAYKELAKKSGMWISFGGIHEAILDSKGEKTNKVCNTHLVLNNKGEIVSLYRKLHLFDVDTPEFRFKESDVVLPGKQIIAPIDTPIGKLGLLICYDLRFPEFSTILRKFGSEILTYPAAFAYSTGLAHWEILLRARAIENQCFVIAPAQIGNHNPKRRSFGRGMIIDPWGKILAECKETDLDVTVANINLDYLEEIRKNMPCFDHRRTDVYTLIPNNISDVLDPTDMDFGGQKIPAKTVFFTSKYCFAFTNIRCVVPGHVLIATKRPAKRIKDLTGEEAADLFETSITVQKFLEGFYGATSSTVTIQDGEDAGQTVKHVHFHIMPRKKGDFAFNDEVYIELRKHDHELETARRPISEMIDEAEKYRKYIQDCYSKGNLPFLN